MSWKLDSGKPRVDLLPFDALLEISKVYAYGAHKYPERDGRTWEDGHEWHRPYAALMRHMWAWWGGETLDPESGLSHLLHGAFNILVLVSYETRRIGRDNRPSKTS